MEYDHFSGTGRNKWHTNYLYVVPNPDDIKQDVYRGFNIENPTKIRKSTIEILDRQHVYGCGGTCQHEYRIWCILYEEDLGRKEVDYRSW